MARESQCSRSGMPSECSPGDRPRVMNGDHDTSIFHSSDHEHVHVSVTDGDHGLREHDRLRETLDSPVISTTSYNNPLSTPIQEDHLTPTGQWSDLVTPGGSHARSPSPAAQEILPNRPEISIEDSSILDLGGIGAHIPDELGGFTDWQGAQYGGQHGIDLLEDDFLNHRYIKAYLRGEGESSGSQEDGFSTGIGTTISASLQNGQAKHPIVMVSAPDLQQDESTPLATQPSELTSPFTLSSWSAELPSHNQHHHHPSQNTISIIYEAPNENAWLPLPEATEPNLLAVGGANDFPTFSTQYQTLEPIGFDAQSAPPVMTYPPEEGGLGGGPFTSQGAVSEYGYMQGGTSSMQALAQSAVSMRRSQSDGGSTSLMLTGTREGRIAKSRRPQLGSSLRKAKGRRRGPLSDGIRMSAREVRMRQTVCISCKRNKTRCLKLDGETLCTACAARAGRSQGYVCALACFAQYARAASFDLITRCGLWHVAPSSQELHHLPLPETICPDWLESLLTVYTSIRVSYMDTTADLPGTTMILYDMDIESCLDQLRSEPNGGTLSAYLNGSAALPQPLACLSPSSKQTMTFDHMLDLSDRILPSQRFFTYSLLRPNNNTPLDLNPLNPTTAKIIQRAAQMSHLLNLSISINAFKSLQEKLTAAFKSGKPIVDPTLPGIVARLACSLRFKAHLWHASGLCRSKEESEGLACVKIMCRTLGGYFLEMKRAGVVDEGEKGRWIRYAGTRRVVYDEFPGEYSEEGLKGWFGEGSEKVKEAEVDWSYLQPMQN